MNQSDRCEGARALRMGCSLISGLLILKLLTAEAAEVAPATPGKLEVTSPEARRAVQEKGGRLLADYDSFQLWEAPASVADELAGRPGLARRDGDDVIELQARRLDTSARSLRPAAARMAAFAGRQLHLVQFVGPIKPEWHAELRELGLRVVSHVPRNAYLVYGDAAALQALRDRAAVSPHFQWEGGYLADDKIHPAAQPAGLKAAGVAAVDELFAVQLVKDPVANEETLRLMDQVKVELVKRSEILDYVNVVVRLPIARVAEVAARPDVVSIQVYRRPEKRDERQGQILAGNLSGTSPWGPGYLAWLAGKGFTAQQFAESGFAVDVSDSGIDNGTTTPGHPGLHVNGTPGSGSRVVYNRLIGTPNFGSTIQACDGHGNINSHIIAGFNDLTGFPHTDSAGYHYGLGIAPFVKVGSSVVFDPNNFTDPNYAELQSRAYQDGARISCNSWGASVSGAYTIDCQAYDALVRDAQPSGSPFPVPGNQEMVIVFSAGNSGSSLGTVGSPGSAKNIISVGAAENVHSHSSSSGGSDFAGNDGCSTPDTEANSADDLASFSSRGPCDDGRIKPDLVGPGTHVTGGVGQQSSPGVNGTALACFEGSGVCALPGGGSVGSPNNFFPLGQQFYTTSSGTSHSCPAVGGGAALLRQFFINRNWSPPSPAMTKAWLMNSARHLTGVGAGDTLPSNNQGMGSMNLGLAFDGTPRIRRDQMAADRFIATGQTRTFEGFIANTNLPFRVTLAWTDAPGSTAGAAYNNDLNLTVTVGGQIYRGNVFAGAVSVSGGTADLRNNVESVFLPAGLGGAFTVTVSAANINSDGVPGNADALDQDFALVILNSSDQPVMLQPAGASLIAEDCAPGNHAIDPGEAVTVTLALRNVGPSNTTALVATLLPANGVTSPSGAQTYGTVTGNGGTVSRSFSFIAAGPCGGNITARLHLQDGTNDFGMVDFEFPVGVLATNSLVFANTNAINISAVGGAVSSYPSSINIGGLSGAISKATVTLHGLTHSWPEDLDILLVGPQGQSVMLLSDAGLGFDAANLTVTLDDEAVAAIAPGAPLTSGTWRPTDFDTNDLVAAPAPAGPYDAKLSVFRHTSPNGSWRLFVMDDYPSDDGGAILQGWSLTLITTNRSCCADPLSVDLAVTQQDAPDPVSISNSVMYTVAVTNYGPATATGVTLSNLLSSKAGIVGVASSQGGYTQSGGSIRCDLGNLAPQAGAVVQIQVIASGGPELFNVASVSSAQSEVDLSNNRDTAVTAVLVPALAISDSTVVEGDSGTRFAVFLVSLFQPAAQVVEVDYRTVAGSATAGVDFVAQSNHLQFLPGEISQTIVVTVLSDVLDEDDEAFQVELLNPSNASLADGVGVGTIIDDEPIPALSIGDASAIEGNSGTTNLITFVVSLSAPSGREVTFTYSTTNATALAGADYLGVSPRSVVLPPGQLATNLSIAIVGDNAVEPNETFLVQLSNATNAVLGDAVGQGTIISDDLAPLVTLAGYRIVTESGVPPNGIIDPNETVTLSVALLNGGSSDTTNLVATLLPTGGVTSPSGPQAYGVLRAGGPAVSRTFTFTVSSPNCSQLNASFQLQDGSVSLGTAGFNTIVGNCFRDDFDPNIDLAQWSDYGGLVGSTIIATNYGGFVSSPNSLWFGDDGERFITSRGLNTLLGGTISFQVRLANGGGYPWEEADDLPAEGVVLESSTDNGAIWTEIGRYADTRYYNWTAVSLPIPAPSQGSSVMFRWRQLSHSGSEYDHWALEDVMILTGPTPPSVVIQPSSRSGVVGGTATFQAVTAGSAPLYYQWRFFGTNLPGQNGQSLFLYDLSLSQAGPYSVVVTNAYGKATSIVALLTVVDGLAVEVFDNPLFVDTGGLYSSESDSIQASLNQLGFVVVNTFTNIVPAASGSSILLFPEQEIGILAPALNSVERISLSNYVAQGGLMIVHGSPSTAAGRLLNTVFGFAVTESSSASDGSAQARTAAAAGTEFADDPATITWNNACTTLATAGLPAGSLSIYESFGQSLVTVIPHGDGTIIFLGWDWFDAVPMGAQNGGWLTVLESAVRFKGLNPRPRVVASGSTLVSEGCGAGNGAIDPGEAVTLSLGLRNAGNRAASNLVATLLPTGGVTAPSGPQNYGLIAPGGGVVNRTFSLVATGVCGGVVTATLQLQDGTNNLGTATFLLRLGAPTGGIVENFDNVTAPGLPPGWIASLSGAGSPWVTTTSQRDTPPNAVFASDPSSTSDNTLTSPMFAAPLAGGTLSFRHAYSTESCCDMGTLQISVSGGPFIDLLAAGGSFVTNGYLSGSGWRGTSAGYPAFITTDFALPVAALGQNIQLRWRFTTDDSTPGIGWYVDTVSLGTGYTCCRENDLELTLADAPDPVMAGSILTYTISVANTGPAASSGVMVTNRLPGNVSFLSAVASQGTCSSNGNVVACALGTIAGGAGAVVTIQVVPATNLVLVALTNVATVSRTEPEGNQANNTALAVTQVIPPPGTGMFDDFDPGIDLTQWSAFGGTVGSTVLATNHGGSVSSPNSLWFGDSGSRFATTRTLNTTPGGIISFQLRLGTWIFPWENVDLPGKGVVLESSTEGGQNWVELGRYDTAVFQSWTPVLLEIPPAARAPVTVFRWRQLAHSGSGYDHWALDDVLIATGPVPPFILGQPESRLALTGGSASFGVIAVGSLPLRYQWRFNNSNDLSGATNATLQLTSLDVSQAGGYTVVVSNSHGAVTSSIATLTIVTGAVGRVAILGAPGSTAFNNDVANKIRGTGIFGQVDVTTVEFGFPVPTLSGLLQYDAVLVYSAAYFNDRVALGNVLADYSDAGGGVVMATFAFDGSTLGISGRIQSGGYLPFTTGGYNSGTPMSLVPDLQLHPILASVTEFRGGSGSWHNTGITMTPGATQVAHWTGGPPLVGTKQTGAGRVVGLNFYPPSSSVQSDYWDVTSDGAQLMANALLWSLQSASLAPGVVRQPVAQVTAIGGSATFNVLATGSRPLHYQWWFNGTNRLTGATNSLLALTALGTNSAGGYSVVITNVYGAVTSTVAALSVVDVGGGFADAFDPAVNLPQWSSFGGTVGSTVLATNFGESVSAPNSLWLGGGGLRYATTRSIDTRGGGWLAFHLRFGNGINPWELVDLPGKGVVLESSTNGGTIWMELGRYDTATYYSWTPVSLSLPAPTLAPSTLFRWRQLSHAGFGSDQWALDNVLVSTGPTPPSIVAHPGNRLVAAGGTATFTVTAFGSLPLRYQWRFNATNQLAGATNATLQLTPVTTNDAGGYSVVVANAHGSVTSSVATLFVLPEASARVAILGAPNSESFNNDVSNKIAGTMLFKQVDARFVRAGYPVPTLAELLQYNAVLVYSDYAFNNAAALGDVLADYADAGGGVVIGTFAFYSGAPGMAGRLQTGGYLPFTQGGQSQGTPMSLVADQPAHPLLMGVSAFRGGVNSFHNNPIAMTSGATLVAHWSNGQPLIGTKQPTLGRVVGLNFYPPSSSVQSDYWDVTSDGALLMANALLWASQMVPSAPFILTQPSSQTAVAGSGVTFSVAASGTRPLSYQWRLDTAGTIAGATNSSLQLLGLTTGQSGGYSVVITNVHGSVTSAVATLTVVKVTNLVVSLDDSGWYSQTGLHNASNSSYQCGILANTEYRNWFVFALPDWPSAPSGAELRVATRMINTTHGSETYLLRHVSTPVATLRAGGFGLTGIYDDLADGPVYGTQALAPIDSSKVISIPLNTNLVAELSALSGSQIALGGHISTLVGNSNQVAFFGSIGNATNVQLVVRFEADPALRLWSSVIRADGTFDLWLGRVDGQPMTTTEAARTTVYATGDIQQPFSSWSMVSTPPVLTNGMMRWNNLSSSSAAQQFYRVRQELD